MNIHPRAACGIYTFIGCLIMLFFNKVVKIDINSPFYIVFIIIFFIAGLLVDKYFTKRYKNPRDESMYYDDTFQDNPFEKEKIDESKE